MNGSLRWRHGVGLAVLVLVTLSLSAIAFYALRVKAGLGSSAMTVVCPMPAAGGLRVGTRVRLHGIPIGQVSTLELTDHPEFPVTATLSIDRARASHLHADARLRLLKDGLVGERVLELDAGTPSEPLLTDGATVGFRPVPEWEDVVRRVDRIAAQLEEGKGSVGRILADDEAYRSLVSTLAQLNKTVAQLTAITEGIQQGNGTVGRLVRDDDLYVTMRDTIRRANDTLTAANEHYASLQKSRPIRWMVDDHYQMLIRPHLRHEVRKLAESELFAPGDARLTDQGKSQLDALVPWIRATDEANAELLVAAFAEQTEDGRLADQVTHHQAEAVAEYLKSRHRISWTGYFSWRTVTAHGFGNRPYPETGKPDSATAKTAEPRATEGRIELILFLP